MRLYPKKCFRYRQTGHFDIFLNVIKLYGDVYGYHIPQIPIIDGFQQIYKQISFPKHPLLLIGLYICLISLQINLFPDSMHNLL